MEPVTGIFNTHAEAQRAITELEAAGIAAEHISVLMPGSSAEQLANVPVIDAEQTGMGKVMGGVVGGAVGAAGGLSLSAAAASIFIPAVGPVLAIGLLGAALFGAGGAVGGAVAGEALEGGIDEGLPVDEMFVYEDALRQGRFVVVVLAEENLRADIAREVMRLTGAESVDSARTNWWVGLRDAEKEGYTPPSENFESVERNYQSGFEAALRPQMRGKTYEDGVGYLSAKYPEIHSDDAFRRGYQRGQSYYQHLIAKRKSAG